VRSRAVKVTIIEGSPEELAEYEARTGLIGTASATAKSEEGAEDPLAMEGGPRISGTNPTDEVTIGSFVFGRARAPWIGEHVEAYVRKVLDLGGVVIEIGTSQTSRDGHADYLLVYNAGPRHYGAVAYVNAKNAGLTLRLTRNDVADLSDPHVKFRDVQGRNGYQINCPLKSPDAIDVAVKLTERALGKIR
jgi:hypothetical protein